MDCLVLAFIGASLLALFKSEAEDDQYPLELLGCAIALGAAVAEALTYLSMRGMNLTLHHSYSTFWIMLGLGAFCLGVLLTMPDLIHFWQWTGWDALYLGLAAVSDILGQNFCSVAFRYGEASKVGPIMYTIPVFSYVADVGYFA